MNTFIDSATGRICALCLRPETSARGRCPGTAGARARGAAQGHTLVDLRQGGKVVSVFCTVCSSYGGRVVRRAPTPGRRLALRDVLLGFLPSSKRAALLDFVPGGVSRAESVFVAPGATSLRFSAPGGECAHPAESGLVLNLPSPAFAVALHLPSPRGAPPL